MDMRIATVVGARPQFVKAAVVSRALAGAVGLQETLVHTGQHYDSNMSDVFFAELDIPKPTYSLGIGGGTHGQNTGRMVEAVENVLAQESPDWVLVFGDTDTTLAGMLAASKLGIRVAHVEAGLRSNKRFQPEEINRVLTDHGADVLFAPTETAMTHLHREGLGDKSLLVGDVMYDAALYYAERAAERSTILERLGLAPGNFVLATVHRAETTDQPQRLAGILRGFADSGQTIVLPLHPRTRKQLAEYGISLPSNVRAIDPVGYLDMVNLERSCTMIATDSGGVQKEAFFYHRFCLTLRDETEWTELVEIGANCLVGCDSARIAVALSTPIEINWGAAPFGDGSAGRRIADWFADASRDRPA